MTGLTARQLQWWDARRLFLPAIAPQRTTNTRAVLPLIHRQRAPQQRVARIQRVVSKIPVEISLEHIRSTFRDDADVAAESAAKLRLPSRRHDLELIDGVDAIRHSGKTRGIVVRGQAVHNEVVRKIALAANRESLARNGRCFSEQLSAGRVRRRNARNEQGKVDEAEMYALRAIETVGPQDVSSQASTKRSLALIRAHQGRDEEAEALLRESIETLERSEYTRFLADPLETIIEFLIARQRVGEAVHFQERLTELRSDAMPEEDPPVAAAAVLGLLQAIQRGGRRIPAAHPGFRLSGAAFLRMPRPARRLLARIAARLTPGDARR